MSRTYRRTQKGQKRSWLFRPSSWRTWDKEIEHFVSRYPHRARDIDDYFHWLHNEPWYWRHNYHTIPMRAETRHLIHWVLSDKTDADDLVWPDGKKPHIYYW